MELGLEVFASTMVWRLLTNGGMIYVAFGELEKKGHYISLTTGMTGYGISLGWRRSGWSCSLRTAIRASTEAFFGDQGRGRSMRRSVVETRQFGTRE